MANQQELSDYIKKVHITLRLISREIGPEAAWEQHCKNAETLQKYATAMRDLATLYWDKNNAHDPKLSRIYWVVKNCEEYFFGGGKEAALMKENKLGERYFGKNEKSHQFNTVNVAKLLDVGSCYNPFQSFPVFDVTAIDLAPASENVLQCEFLNVDIEQCGFLKTNYFDVVVFSLLLEYLPDPRQRYKCCKKAYDLLMFGGILIVLTPDSKHATANSRMMKNWRKAFSHIGFLRIKYEKLKHLHCMMLMKCFNPSITSNWFSLQQSQTPPEDLLTIPQDENSYEELTEKLEFNEERSESDNNKLAETFSLLAGDQLF